MNSKKVKIGNVYIGQDSPISVQSMLKIKSDDFKKNIIQAQKLEKAGCDILRVAVPNFEAIKNIYNLKTKIKIPIVADIHFDYKLALESVSAGVDKIRINPGNIANQDHIKLIAKICNEKNIPIRIGVNSGSLERKILSKYKKITPEAMCESAIYNIKLLEKFDFNNIVISLKSSDVKKTVIAYKAIFQKINYPLHLGITEAGTEKLGKIKSFVGIGSLLLDGIGDTIRITLTSDPVKEVKAGIDLLKSLNLYKKNINLISCPTCGRTKIDIISLSKKAEKIFSNFKYNNKNLNIAIMGCEVNGPGESKFADIGIAGGNEFGILFKKGKIVKKVEEKYLLKELVKEVDDLLGINL
ncbi:MAG: flavodoxin-dependent (E)-4-hydroxy-3 methylbut-2-enyl-diphosphate synthase [Candidatus Paraimprobicoccus trichonymphae]|uniref:4-hydroxy-3-methylbut-2-en-1-yl diphosphate synthase (flavodoxin) n=1 Tax=Candidatus Paraimprobicoccus trichonymphae TaxID=3033793 RepID=A0AA48KW59_9FIRM|nr:MAG: flavodoxin-dependent (E)-4-hydroxy-3 methylbut-2-enyl-diphosphate synthase [Candidatus Paraimprobicoccus trichonymphae]